jgi:4-hydroxy-3-methylbut-2-en-1-yl diphosphate synthase IspG/GcpE
VKAKYRLWRDQEIDQLKALVTSGASALRASVALKRSVVQIKKKARELGFPFPLEADLRTKRRQIFQNSVDRPLAGGSVRISDET